MSEDQEQQARRKRRRAARQAPGRAPQPAPPASPSPPPPDLGTVPEPLAARQHRSAAGRVFYSLFVIFALAALSAVALAAFGYEQYIGSGPLTATKVVEVRKGLHTPDIAADLETAGVISDAKLFTAAAFLTGSRGRLKAGEYEFAAGISMRDVLGRIVQGKSMVYKLTIPEGWTTAQALERVRDNEILTGELTLSPPEGALLPDTYLFQRGATRDSVVRQMMEAQEKLVSELWQSRAPDLVVKSVNEAVTLASIVEKETGVAEERPRVAAVFINRLKKRMRLQSDPTIIYGLVGGNAKLERPLTKQDIAQKTPYNTYRVDGLPPGPIANPGRAALMAVLNPTVTSDLYFVADGSGGHAFAETLADHRKNVAKWRMVERQRDAGEAEYVDELAAEKAGEASEQPSESHEPAPQPTEAQQTKPRNLSIPPPPLPEGTAVSEATGSTDAGGREQKIVTPELPAIDNQSAAAGENGKAGASDPKTTEQTAAVPLDSVKPLPQPPAGESPPSTKPKAAGPPPPPQSNDKSKAAAEPAPANQGSSATKTEKAAAAAVTGIIPLPRAKPRQARKPGEIVKVADRLVPIPMPKPKPR